MSKRKLQVYTVYAVYTSVRELEVEVEEGEDPTDPSAWVDVVYERESDLSLDRVVSAELLSEYKD